MLLVTKIKETKRRKMSKEEENLFGIDKLNIIRSSVPAITHVDYSARIQTVNAKTNQRYHKMISKFEQKLDVQSLLPLFLMFRANHLHSNRYF